MTFERGSIYRAIRDVLARRLKAKGVSINTFALATKLVKNGYFPKSKNEAKEVINEYEEQLSMMKNYPIVGRVVKAIEYIDVPKARAEGIKNPYLRWRHDFRTNDAYLIGLPDGSILIKSKTGKKLWNYV